MPAPKPRVWITGVGLVTSLGDNRAENWNAIKAGRSGARPIQTALCDQSSSFGYARPGIALTASELAERALDDALRDAAVAPALSGMRSAVVFGVSKGDIGIQRVIHRRLLGGCAANGGELTPRDWTEGWPSAVSAQFARKLGAQVGASAMIAACATGVVCALRGADMIRRGACDIAIVGAADSQLDPLVLGAFRSMRALARVRGDATKAVRPLDRDRSGFLPGEGAAVLVLERDAHARARGVAPYAELVGGAMGSEAYHITGQNADPTDLARLIRVALARSGVDPSEINHINLHGTATRSNDPLECQAIRHAFGPHADTIACTANKSQIGHLLGAAGAAELAITCLSIRDGFVPPTLNLDDPDSACDLDATPHVGRARAIRAALKLSLGFGGHMAVAVLRQT